MAGLRCDGAWRVGEKAERGTEPVNHVKKFAFHPKRHRKSLEGFKQINDMISVFKCHSDCSVETG